MFGLLLGLICLMFANFLLVTNLATLKKEYDKDKMVSGIVKIGGVVLGIVFMLGSAYLTKDIIVANVNNQNVNLLDGMKYVFMAGIVFYGAQALLEYSFSIFLLYTI